MVFASALLCVLRVSAFIPRFFWLLNSEFLILSAVPKWIKFIVGLLLLPVCAGAARALWPVLCAGRSADVVWVPLLAGAACWTVIFFLLPKPMWVYVLGHELTHALWTWLFGGEVKKMKVTSKGGHVVISKTNFVIALAPYFFPLYAVLVIAAFAVGNLIWNWHGYYTWFYLLLGAAYAFHVTLTIHVLQTQQSDITGQGYLFSGVIIFLGNVTVLLFGVPLLTSHPQIFKIFASWCTETGKVFNWLHHLF
jgi:hypothetical protein